MAVIQFNNLTQDEKELLIASPALVTYLIGGADDNFDTKEEVQSSHIVRLRASNGDPLLNDFYTEVEKNYFGQLDSTVKKYERLPLKERSEILINELSKLNTILPKIDSFYAGTLLKSLRSLAKIVAEASGGLMGFIEISYEEKQFVDLDMITYES